MKVLLTLFFCWIALFVGFAFAQPQLDSQSDLFTKGFQHKQNGDWALALKTWLADGQTLQRMRKSDPRIGIAFIELATEQKAEKYYKIACDMYFWGFSQETFPGFKKELEKEIERIAPLLTKKEAKRWRELLVENPSLLKEQIKSFWLSKDPTPSTSLNERLIEHWQRIATARKKFRKAKSTIFGTDDRGLIYIKYGEPDKVSSGMLGTNRAALKRWTDVILDNSRDRRTNFGENSVSVQSAEQTLLLGEIDRFNSFPEYEVWFFYSLDSEESVFFLFGNRGGNGLFGLRSGVEDFIPSSAFLQTSMRNTGGIMPGAVLQSLYYSELMHLNPYFEDRYYELEDVWGMLDTGRSSNSHINTTFKLKRTHYRSLDAHAPLHAFAPAEKSNFEKVVSKVDLVVHSFRFLEQNAPKLAILIFSYPQIKAEFIDFASGNIIPDYSTVHTLIAQNSGKQEIKRLTDFLGPGQGGASTFVLPHSSAHNEYKLIAEVFSSKGQSSGAKSVESKQVIGIGNKIVPATSVLSYSEERLELSDLIIGLEELSSQENKLLYFPIIPSDKIWVGDLLQIYLEIYHLFFDSDGITHYQIDFQATKLKGKKRRQDQSIALSFNFDSPDRTAKENFKVDLSKLSPGSYKLIVRVADTVSLQHKERSAFFEIIERK